MKFGFYYGTRKGEPNSTLNSGAQNITITDIFFEKSWDKLTIAMEIPMLSGSVNNAYNTGTADIDTRAMILESNYKLNSKWNIGFFNLKII